MKIYDIRTAAGRAMQNDLDTVSAEELQAAGEMHDALVSGAFYVGKRMMPESKSAGASMNLVSYAMCERVIERDARITHFAQKGWWRVTIEGRRFEGQTRNAAVREAARDLQRRLESEVVA